MSKPEPTGPMTDEERREFNAEHYAGNGPTELRNYVPRAQRADSKPSDDTAE